MPEEERVANVPFYIHEAVCDKMERANERMMEANNKALEKVDKSNKRLLAALVVVCITLVITVCCFLSAYKDMNNTWLDFFEENIEEAQDGMLHDEGNRGAD